MNITIHKMCFTNNDYNNDMCVYHYNIDFFQSKLSVKLLVTHKL